MSVLIAVTRRTFTPKSTISDWTVTRQGEEPQRICVGLEDVDRGLSSAMSKAEIAERKVHGRTAIPSGEYGVIMTHSPRFRSMLPLLMDVRGYQGVRIHAGNSAADTEGCLLPGMDEDADRVTESRPALIAVESIILAAARRGESVRIRITRDPEAWAAFCAAHPEIVKVAA